MASASMAMPVTFASQKGLNKTSESFLKPMPLKPSKGVLVSQKSKPQKLQVQASFKEKAVAGLTAGMLTASMVVPQVAEAASGVSPSLKNFLVSIFAGGVVLAALGGAVIGVAYFDPVKRS
ncbi:hypothetical protein Ancab_023109 [Ancistrocladus abbreviatus]